MEQLTIPESFFAPLSELAGEGEREKAERECLDWLMRTHGCSPEVVPYAKRLFAEFDRAEAWNRSHPLLNLYGVHGADGWSLSDAEYIGLYDHSITDHHVLWDRGWAISMQVPRELVPKVWRCGYGGRPRFFDRDGHVLFESVYSVDGKPLTQDERRQALAERAEQC